MEKHKDRIAKAGLGLAAISYDSPEVLKAFSERLGITFSLLSDPHSRIITEYGILNQSVERTSPVWGVPYPGIYVLDAQGKVVAKYFEDDYKQRDTAAQILMKSYGVEAPGPHQNVTAKHLQIKTSSSDVDVATGQHIVLELAVDLPEKTHVYAPGVQHYIGIDWTIADGPGYHAGPVEYPASTVMRLEVIHESVPVFQDHFRLLRTVTIGDPAELKPILENGGTLSIEGTFRYQACDDVECYLPETVPVKWILHALPLDRTRVPETLRRRAPPPVLRNELRPAPQRDHSGPATPFQVVQTNSNR